MSFVDKTGDFFGGIAGGFERFLTRLFGSSNERTIKQIGYVRDPKTGESSIIPGSVIDRINQLEPEYEKLTEGELKECASKFRARLDGGETLDDILPDAFAAVRESSKRHLKMRHYDVQMVGGYILHGGNIAEMVTGEGKTLVSTLPAFLNALAGHVHVVTVNDYLALRDMEWMGPVHMGLGLTVGAIQANMDPYERQPNYACDICYGTNNEFGFDYLRDNMKPTKDRQVQGPLDFALIDEIDNILIDEARTPLIISGPAYDDVTKYPKANRIALQLKRDVDFEVNEKEHNCHLTEEGIRHAEEIAGVESFYTAGNMEWPHLIDNALKAHYLYKRDHQYMIKEGSIVIVDEHTGRPMEGRQWSDGLHQAVEAKEGVKIKEESQTLATITLQNYFKLYKKLGGMTGTAMTEASEFWKIYQLDVVSVPTNRPLARINHPDMVYLTEDEKWDAVVEEIKEVHKEGRPILVGTVSIEKSELISRKLQKFGIDHAVLNAKYIEKEAELIAQAGRKSAVTIATNMAGRGTDIILGGNPENLAWETLKRTYNSRLDIPKSEWDAMTQKIAEQEGMIVEGKEVSELGGLHVIGTERHDARRIDLQLRGRSGRQGDPGSSRFFVSLDDDLLRLFAGDRVKALLQRLGMGKGEAIESGMVTKRIEAAQKKREEIHFDQRKHLLEYDEVMDDQRKRVYAYRQEILDGASPREKIQTMIDNQVDYGVNIFLDPMYRWDTIVEWTLQNYHVMIDGGTIRDMEKEQLVTYIRDEAVIQAEDLLEEKIDESLPEDAENRRDWNWKDLTHWANVQWGLNLNERELKKIPREELRMYMLDRAAEAVERYDFTDLDVFLQEDFPLDQLCGWLNQQFALEVVPASFKELEQIEEAIDLVHERINQLYQEKEIQFPVSVGMSRFMTANQNVGDKYDREGLIHWINNRFAAKIDMDDLKNKNRDEVESLLGKLSQDFYISHDITSRVDEYLDQAYDGSNGVGVPQDDPQATAALGQLAHWANSEFQANLEPQDFESLSREGARQKVLACFDQNYRLELSQAERVVILEILDTAWKEHLYYMDHLRSTIGLASYAQKDSKVEYKREGRKAFAQMWERVGQQVTSAIFRLEKDSPEFVGGLWEITSTGKAAAPSEAPQEDNYDTNGANDGGDVGVVDTIRNAGPKVGRNDPCPCNSGKKYKKCCGMNQ